MKRIILNSLFIVFVFSTFASAQQRRTGPPIHQGPPPPQKLKIVPANEPLNDFAKKGLPKAYVFGGIPNKALAQKAAELILKNDDDSLSALIGALQLSGFYIIDKNKKILFAPQRSNGAAFKDFEVAGLLRGSYFGFETSLEKYGKTLAGKSQKLQKYDIGGGLFNDLQLARTSKDEQNLFLAELIFALGKGNGGLTSPQSKLNFIQASLIERRFLTDLVSAFETASGGQSLLKPQLKPDSPFAGIFVNASYEKQNSVFSNAADSPCPAVDTMEDAVGYKGKGEKVGKFFGYEHAGKQAIDEMLENSDAIRKSATELN